MINPINVTVFGALSIAAGTTHQLGDRLVEKIGTF
jgi:hypothetical protein